VFFRPGGEEVFLREVEVRVLDAESGGVFGHRDRGGTEVEGIVLAASLKNESFGNDRG